MSSGELNEFQVETERHLREALAKIGERVGERTVRDGDNPFVELAIENTPLSLTLRPDGGTLRSSSRMTLWPDLEFKESESAATVSEAVVKDVVDEVVRFRAR